MGNEITVYSEMEKKAVAVAKSGLFGVRSPEQAIALFLVAEAEGIPIMQAVLDYHIIDNKPSLKADAMLRRFQSSGGIVKWVDRSDAKVSAYFSHPNSPEPILIDWDMARAIKAGVGTKDNWKKYPRQMLTARVLSEGIRATAPGHAAGIYTPEEVQDFDQTLGKPTVSMPKATPEPQKQTETAQEAEIVENTAIDTITAEEVAVLRDLLKKNGDADKEPALVKGLGAVSLETLKPSDFKRALVVLHARKDEKAKSGDKK